MFCPFKNQLVIVIKRVAVHERNARDFVFAVKKQEQKNTVLL